MEIVRRHRGFAAIALCVASVCGLMGCSAELPDDPDAVGLAVLVGLDAQWRDFGTTDHRPLADDYKFLLPGGVGPAIMRCMRDAGYDNYAVARASDLADHPRSEPTPRESVAYYSCYHAWVGYDPSFDELSDDQIAVLYDYYRRSLVPCLEAAGFSVADVPTADGFAQPVTGQPGGWNPYLTAVRPGRTNLVSVMFDRCPAYPVR
jgi:hypothetical protein